MREKGNFFVQKEGRESERSRENKVRGRRGVGWKMLFWNMAGVKNKEIDTWNYLKKFGIINISETWLKEGEEGILEKNLEGYKVWTVPGERSKKKGRLKGGTAIAIKKKHMEGEGIWKVVMEKELGIITWKKGKESWKVLATYAREERGKCLKALETETEKVRKEGGRIIIGGDWNARTGREGGNPEEEDKRRSKDRVINGDGRRLIEKLEEEGLYILNGGLNWEDTDHFTYIGGGGEPVIDYVISNAESADSIREMKIGERMESDHLPVEVRIGVEEEEWGEEGKKGRKSKREWTESSARELKRLIKEDMKEMCWTKLEGMMRSVMVLKESRTEKKGDMMKWWDEDCHKSKLKLSECWKECRADKESWEEYRKYKKRHKSLIRNKKERKMEEVIRLAKEDRSERKWWSLVNSRRKKKEGLDETIADEEWKSHFMKQLGGVEKPSKKGNREKIIGRPEDDFTLEEVEKVIKNLKKRKAAGEDEIKNEAWKSMGVEGKLALTDALNRIWRDGEFPEEWRGGVVRPIFKKGERSAASNYRGITLMATGYKIYAEILRKRLEKELEEKKLLGHTQMGFRKRRGTIDAIYVLKTAVNKELRKKNKMIGFFADLKGAFDALRREEIWNRMRKIGISEQMRTRIEEIYQETECSIWVGERMVGRFYTEEGVRQGCPLSPTLYNIATADLEEEMRKAQEGGIVIGKKKIWTISYADDIVFLANNVAGMKELIRKFRKYLGSKGLELNAAKSKMMTFKKGRDKREKTEWWWGKERIEEVKEFTYLGYLMTRNNEDTAHVKERVRKARGMLGKVWSIGEKLCKDDWQRRMRLFVAIIEGVLAYGAEIWGWRRWENIEKCQGRFMKWTMGVNLNTPDHILMRETGRKSMWSRLARRAMKYEKKIWEEKKEGTIIGECWDEEEKGKREYKSYRERETFYEKIGWGMEESKKRLRVGINNWIDACDKLDELERNSWLEKIRESRFAESLKIIWEEEEKTAEYLVKKEKNRKDELRVLARFRLGSETRGCEYWKSEEERKCRMCGEKSESLQHIVEECSETGRPDICWKECVKGDGRCLAILWKIIWKRKRKEEEEKDKMEKGHGKEKAE